ncbi:DUF5060 domain-containing protein [bacterium]|nr:DUF5060 domain-containing protein [bacterium]
MRRDRREEISSGEHSVERSPQARSGWKTEFLSGSPVCGVLLCVLLWSALPSLLLAEYRLYFQETDDTLFAHVLGEPHSAPFDAGLLIRSGSVSANTPVVSSQYNVHKEPEAVIEISRPDSPFIGELTAIVFDGTRFAISDTKEYAQFGSLLGSTTTQPQVTGERLVSHEVTLELTGPMRSENSGTFRNYRLFAKFTHVMSGAVFRIPGYFAADGDAAQSGASRGDQWRVRFSPPFPGLYVAETNFRQGPNIALDPTPNTGTPIPGDGELVSFFAGKSRARSGFRKDGRVVKGRGRYFKHLQTGAYYLKSGADSPETFMAATVYRNGQLRPEFDNTINVGRTNPDFSVHVADWRPGDPTWRGDGGAIKGKGVTGALNFLARHGGNAFYFLGYNVDGGDGGNVFPWVSPSQKSVFDVSKLEQWRLLFNHATERNIAVHFVLQEEENDAEKTQQEELLFIREILARYGSNLAFFLNLGEEYRDRQTSQGGSTQILERDIAYARQIFPFYGPLFGLHNPPNDWSYFTASGLDFVSLQTGDIADVPQEASQLHISHPGISKAVTEVGPDSVGVSRDGRRDEPTFRGQLLASAMCNGAYGIQYYFGYRNNSDFTDIFSRGFENAHYNYSYSELFQQGKRFLDFFRRDVDLEEMEPSSQSIVNRAELDCGLLSNDNTLLLLYLSEAGSSRIQLPSGGLHDVTWYDPDTGSESYATVTGSRGQRVNLRRPSAGDWLVRVEKR